MFYYHGWRGGIAFITARVQTRDSHKEWKLKGVTFNDTFTRFQCLWRLLLDELSVLSRNQGQTCRSVRERGAAAAAGADFGKPERFPLPCPCPALAGGTQGVSTEPQGLGTPLCPPVPLSTRGSATCKH